MQPLGRNLLNMCFVTLNFLTSHVCSKLQLMRVRSMSDGACEAGPNPRRNVGEWDQNKAVQSEGCEGVPRFHAVRLAIASENHISGKERKKAKTVEPNIRPVPRCAPFCLAPNAT